MNGTNSNHRPVEVDLYSLNKYGGVIIRNEIVVVVALRRWPSSKAPAHGDAPLQKIGCAI